MDVIVLIAVVALVFLALYLYFRFFKLLKVKNILFIDGSLGTGKSFLSVALAVRLWKRNVRRYHIKRFLLRVFNVGRFKDRWKAIEKPILYSNMRLANVPFTLLTSDLILRHGHRFAYKSVVLIDEFSLMADQYCYKDREVSERLSLFFKLFRHETKGGYCVINSQSTSDLHYSIKYVLSDYLYIHHNTRLPFVCVLRCQEMLYCADQNGNQITNVNGGDVEDSLKTMIVLKKYFKYYDGYCYSVFTDMLPVEDTEQYNEKRSDLKLKRLLSYKSYDYLYENLDNEIVRGDVSNEEAQD